MKLSHRPQPFVRRIFRHRVFLLYTVAICLITGIAYGSMVHAFFSNDEFLYILGTKTDGLLFGLNSGSWLQHLAGVNRPFGTLLQNFFHIHYPWDIRPFLFIGIPFHILNCLMVYVLAKKLSKNTLIAISSGFIFASMNVATQAIDWLACILEIPTSTFFALLSIYFTLRFLESKKRYLLVLTILSAYIGFLFKDAVIFLFFVLPIILYIYEMKSSKKSIWFYSTSFFFAILLFLMRLDKATNTPARAPLTLTPSGLANIVKNGSIAVRILYDSFVYPFIGIIQSIIPSRYLQKFIDHPQLSPHLTQIRIDLFIVFCGLLLCIAVFLLLKRVAEKKQLFVLSVLYLAPFIPIIFILTWRNSTFIEARYLYFPSIMISITLGFVLNGLYQHARKSRNSVHKFLYAATFIAIVLYTGKQLMVVRSMVYWDTTRQQEVKNVVMTLEKYKDQIPPNPIFYINSDYDYYWPNNKLPVQQGVGLMLEVIFYDTGKIPKGVAQKYYLQPFGSQGYETSGGKGFGYFYDETELAKLFRDNPELSIDQIVAFQFASRDQSFTVVTDQIKERVKTLAAPRY